MSTNSVKIYDTTLRDGTQGEGISFSAGNAATDTDHARNGLMSEFGLSEIQAQAILDLRLRALTALMAVERWFLYMPFEHAEDLTAQETSLELFARLRSFLEPAQLVTLTAFGGLMIATNVFNNQKFLGSIL